jgi:16S rRNA (cytosine1402-N4)-methyltransferase
MEPAPDLPIPPRPKRRKRYSGNNPKHFHQKYKEHNPEKYPETFDKVLDSGKTPAGTHRPIMVNEILDVLNPHSGEIAVDATLGYGGHSREIFSCILPGGKLIALDQDPIELPKTEKRLRSLNIPSDSLIVCHTNFAALPEVLLKHQIKGVDLILADLGCSSMQLDDPQRGFSYKLDGPLDLRMNPNRGRSAAVLLEKTNEITLTQIFKDNADEPHSEILAHEIIAASANNPIRTTQELTRIITKTLSKILRSNEDVLASTRRVYQALRIEVNEEFKNLERFLNILPQCLNPGGRVAILSFHSGEDVRVKKAFQASFRQGIYSKITEEIIRASIQEVKANPRSSSAKLRVAIKATS